MDPVQPPSEDQAVVDQNPLGTPPKKFSDESIVRSLVAPADPWDEAKANSSIKVVSDWKKNPTPENNIAFANVVKEKNDQDQTSHINTQTQWVPFIMSVLTGNLGSAYKYWNGGTTRTEEATSPLYKGKLFKEFNQIGATGRYFDENNKEIDPSVIKKLNEKGGYFISKSDTTAQNDPRYQSASELAKFAMTGIPKPVLDQYTKAAQVSNIASQYANANVQLRDILKKDPIIADIIGGMKAEDRSDLAGIHTKYQTLSNNASSAVRQGASGNVTGSQTAGQSMGANTGVGFDGKVLNGSLGGSYGQNSSATNTVSNGSTAGQEANRSTGLSDQIQSDYKNEVERIINKKIDTSQFFAIQKYLALDSQIRSLEDQMHLEQNAPDTLALGQDINPLLNGHQNAILRTFGAQHNAAINSAWASFLAKRINENNGDIGDMNENMDLFRKTNTYKGIKYTYGNKIKHSFSEEKHVPKEGDIEVRMDNNMPRVYKNGNWEDLNER
jgi:hypothetical protein